MTEGFGFQNIMTIRFLIYEIPVPSKALQNCVEARAEAPPRRIEQMLPSYLE